MKNQKRNDLKSGNTKHHSQNTKHHRNQKTGSEQQPQSIKDQSYHSYKSNLAKLDFYSSVVKLKSPRSDPTPSSKTTTTTTATTSPSSNNSSKKHCSDKSQAKNSKNQKINTITSEQMSSSRSESSKKSKNENFSRINSNGNKVDNTNEHYQSSNINNSSSLSSKRNIPSRLAGHHGGGRQNSTVTKNSSSKSRSSNNIMGNRNGKTSKRRSFSSNAIEHSSSKSTKNTRTSFSSSCSTNRKSMKSLDKSMKNRLNLPMLAANIQKIEATPGAILVRNETAINTTGYLVERTKLDSTDYAQVFRARRVAKGKKIRLKSASGSGAMPRTMVVKITNLTECSPRFRINLLTNSVRIMRFIGNPEQKPISSLFITIFDIFQMQSSKLYVFMEECVPKRSLYDLVRSSEAIKAEEIRGYIRVISIGVEQLQRLGVAHRYLKLQHILFDRNNKPKLCGWSKSVFFYDVQRQKILLQHRERRVRRNYFLPPEAFLKPYDPSKADIWSIGVLLVCMSTKRYPFNVRVENQKFSTQWREFVKKHQMNTYTRNFCNKIFIIDPAVRISSSKLLEDKYFSVPRTKLLPLSIRGDPNIIEYESSRIGALSTTDLDLAKPRMFDPEDIEAIKEDLAADKLEAEEEKKEISSLSANNDLMNNNEPKTENNNDYENDGGNVGDEYNIPENEMAEESQMAENLAPEESENAATPEDGDDIAQ